MEMFDAKSDVRELSTEEVVKLDYKEFDFSGHKFGIGVMETTNKEFGLERKEEILEILKKIKENDKLEAVCFSVIDILKEENYTLCSGEKEKEMLKEVFNFEDREGVLFKKGLVSRKKEIVPIIENYFNK